MSSIQPLTVSKYLTISPSVALKTHCFSSHFIYQNIKYLICFAFIFINKTAAYLMMLIIKAVYTILFVCKDIYLLIKPTVYALRFTLDIIELRYVWWFSLLLSRYPKIFTFSFCSILYLPAEKEIFEASLELFPPSMTTKTVLSSLIFNLLIE